MIYHGPTYHVIVDGEVIRTFHTLIPLRPHQIKSAAEDYRKILGLTLPPVVERYYGRNPDSWQPLADPIARVIKKISMSNGGGA